MTKEYSVCEKKPSKMFLKALHGGGSSNITCHCGRRHYAPHNLDGSEDENDYQLMLDSCREEQKKDPKGVIIEPFDDFVYYKELGGNPFVVDCPCSGLRRYEDFIRNNRDSIRDYYKFRIDQEAKWADAELIKNKLAGI